MAGITNTEGVKVRHIQCLALSFLAFTGLACSPSTVDFIQLSYEVMPGVGFDNVYHTADPYSERAAFTAQLEADLVPDIFTTLGEDYQKLDTQTVPGGYLLELNPSLQTRMPEDWAATTRAAAALGVVLLQWSVLLTDFTPSDSGNTGYGAVAFPAGTLDEEMAGDFFTYASTVNDGLGGGFFAFGDSMYFLNIADSQGQPYSGLTDEAFIAALDQAARDFTGAETKLAAQGKCDARFVENDWDGKTAGEDYWAALSDLDQARKDQLAALQDEFKTLFQGAVTQYGWDTAAPPPMPPRRGFYGHRFLSK